MTTWTPPDYLFVTENGCFTGQAAIDAELRIGNTEFWAKLTWQSERYVIHETNLAHMQIDHVAFTSAYVLGRVQDLAPAATVMRQMNSLMPSELGLRIVGLEDHARFTSAQVLGVRAHQAIVDAEIISHDTDLMRSLVRTNSIRHGWFSPDADPTVFGTPFMVATLSRGVAGWGIYFVGMKSSDEADFAPWSDAEAIRTLAKTVVETSPEDVVVLSSLEDSNKTNRQRERYLYRAAVKDAGATFQRAKNRIKPRLTEKALDGARAMSASECSELGVDLFYGARNMSVRYNHGIEEIGSLDNGRPMWAYGRATVIPESGADEETRDLAAKAAAVLVKNIARQVRVSDLGQVVTTVNESNGAQIIWVVRSVDLLRQHPVALSVPKGAQLRVVS